MTKTSNQLTTYPHLAVGDLFLWKGKTWIKMRHGKARRLKDSKVFAFGFTNEIRRIEEREIYFDEYPSVIMQINALLRRHGLALRCRRHREAYGVLGRIEFL